MTSWAFYDAVQAAKRRMKPRGWTWEKQREHGVYQLRKDGAYAGVVQLAVGGVHDEVALLDTLVRVLNEARQEQAG